MRCSIVVPNNFYFQIKLDTQLDSMHRPKQTSNIRIVTIDRDLGIQIGGSIKQDAHNALGIQVQDIGHTFLTEI